MSEPSEPGDPYDDRLANSLVATGAVLAVLWAGQRHPGLTSVEILDDGDGNQLLLRFDFLASPYLLTVEQVIEQ